MWASVLAFLIGALESLGLGTWEHVRDPGLNSFPHWTRSTPANWGLASVLQDTSENSGSALRPPLGPGTKHPILI